MLTSKTTDSSKTTKKPFSSEYFTKKSYYWFNDRKIGLTIATYIIGGVEHYFGHTVDELPPTDVDRVIVVEGPGTWIPIIDGVLEIDCSTEIFSFIFTKRKFSPSYVKKIEGISGVTFTRKSVYLFILQVWVMTWISVGYWLSKQTQFYK